MHMLISSFAPFYIYYLPTMVAWFADGDCDQYNVVFILCFLLIFLKFTSSVSVWSVDEL